MADLTQNQILDYKKWYLPGGDKDFNPKKNQEVIEATIKKTDDLKRKRDAEYREAIAERSDAAVSYLFSRKGAQSRQSVEKYFGKEELARLRAEDILTKLKSRSLLN
jgi:hypothetical protein